MAIDSRLRMWLRALLRRGDVERDLRREIDAHIAMEQAHRERAGLSPEEAHREARIAFGGVERYKEAVRDEHGTRILADLSMDLRYVVRSLRRSPGFVAGVALTLALGLGANAAIFSLLDRLFLRPQPGLVRPADIHRIYKYEPSRPGGPPPAAVHPADVQSFFTYPHYRDLRSTIPGDIPLAGYGTAPADFGPSDSPPSIVKSYVIGDYFSLLGARPAAGRFFAPEELHIETPRALVVISARLWKAQFGASPDAVGRYIELDGHRHLIIGVAAAPFLGPDNNAVDLWVPMNTLQGFRPDPVWYQSTHTWSIRLLFLAATKAQLSTATIGATTVFRHGSVFPDSLAEVRIGGVAEPVMPGSDPSSVNIATRLAGVSVIVLLIACANIGNLLLTRGMRRRREIAVRLSLGVGRTGLIRLFLMEGLVLALAGAAIALGVGLWAAAVLRHFLMPDTQWVDGPIDLRIIAFTLVVALVAGLGVALIPALQASKPDLVVALKAGAREGGHQRSRLRTGMLIAQAALSVVLLAGAGLFVRSLQRVETEGTGYDSDRLVFANVSWNGELSDHSADIAARFPDYLARLRKLPGVEAVAYDNNAPFRGMQFMEFHLPGRDVEPHGPATTTQGVSPEYFGAVGIRVLDGRAFGDGDGPGAPLVIAVSQTVAEAFWPGQNALGQCVIIAKQEGPCREVVGIVSDVHQHSIVEDESAMQMYIPKAQDARPTQGDVIVRAAPRSIAGLIPLIRKATTATYGDWAVPRVHAMSEALDVQLHPWRVGAVLFSAAGLLALVVSVIGIYSTISHVYSQRTHEMGVRMALGAQAVDVVRLVIGEGVRVVFVGIVIGVALALLGGRLVESMLYKTSAHDVLVLVVVPLLLLLVAVAACLAPAWRAISVDPATALRTE